MPPKRQSVEVAPAAPGSVDVPIPAENESEKLPIKRNSTDAAPLLILEPDKLTNTSMVLARVLVEPPGGLRFLGRDEVLSPASDKKKVSRQQMQLSVFKHDDGTVGGIVTRVS